MPEDNPQQFELTGKVDINELLTTLLKGDNPFAKDFADRVVPYLTHQIRSAVTVDPITLNFKKVTDKMTGSMERFLDRTESVQNDFISLQNKALTNLSKAITERLRLQTLTFKSWKDPLDQLSNAMP
jgi:hypothetical protein